MKLPRIQFHLSTALVMMLVAGVLIYANVRTRIKLEDVHHPRLSNGSAFYKIRTHYQFGWPFTYYDCDMGGVVGIAPEKFYLTQKAKIIKFNEQDPVATLMESGFNLGSTWSSAMLAADVAIAVAIILAFAFIFECCVARRRSPLK